MSTCNRLDLQTLGFQPVMPKNVPITDVYEPVTHTLSTNYTYKFSPNCVAATFWLKLGSRNAGISMNKIELHSYHRVLQVCWWYVTPWHVQHLLLHMKFGPASHTYSLKFSPHCGSNTFKLCSSTIWWNIGSRNVGIRVNKIEFRSSYGSSSLLIIYLSHRGHIAISIHFSIEGA